MSTSEQLETSTAESSSLWVPPELISLILSILWDASQTPQERAALLRNVASVNRTWLALVVRISSRDVHISSYRNASVFVRYLSRVSLGAKRGIEGPFSEEAYQVAREACRSLTFHVDGNPWPGCPLHGIPSVSWSFRAASNTLYVVKMVYPLLNLRHVSLRYTDREYSSIFMQMNKGCGLPDTVTHLSIHYSFTDSASNAPPLDLARDMSCIRIMLTRQRPVLSPHVRHLSLSGIPATLVGSMLRLCPNVETLEIAHPEPQPLFTLAPLPPSVRTLVLRRPGVALTGKEMRSWELSSALDGGLFHAPARGAKLPRIVVCSGTPDPVAFIKLWRSCKDLHVELVYEHDDDSSPSL